MAGEEILVEKPGAKGPEAVSEPDQSGIRMNGESLSFINKAGEVCIGPIDVAQLESDTERLLFASLIVQEAQVHRLDAVAQSLTAFAQVLQVVIQNQSAAAPLDIAEVMSKMTGPLMKSAMETAMQMAQQMGATPGANVSLWMSLVCVCLSLSVCICI